MEKEFIKVGNMEYTLSGDYTKDLDAVGFLADFNINHFNILKSKYKFTDVDFKNYVTSKAISVYGSSVMPGDATGKKCNDAYIKILMFLDCINYEPINSLRAVNVKNTVLHREILDYSYVNYCINLYGKK